MSERKPGPPHQALNEIDRIFHEKARLGIMTTLVASADPVSFNELKQLCQLTDGNLNRHLKVLVDAGALSVKKSGQGRTTSSHYRLTAQGRRAFEKYLSALESVLLAARKQPTSATHQKPSSSGPNRLGLES